VARDSKRRGLTRVARAADPRKSPKKPRVPRRAPPTRRGLGIALVLALAIAGVVFAPRLVRRAATRGGGAGGTSAERPFQSQHEVWERAQDATNRGELLEAYDLLVRGVAQYPGDADVANAFGVAVNNTSYFVRPVRGRLVPVMATSLDRVGAAQAALAAFDRASSGKPYLASPYHYRGNMYAAWGLPDDAIRELYQARMRGDSTASLLRTAQAILAIQRGAMDETLPGTAP
jgi:hypothetical protein